MIKTWKTSLLFSNTPHNTISKHFPNWNFQTLKPFSKYKNTFLYIQTRIITKVATTMASFQNIFQNHTQSTISNNWKAPFQTIEMQSKWSKQVTKSPWITMDRKDANTFPFYNLPPVLRISRKSIFYVLFSFPIGWNKSRWRLLLTVTFCKHKMQNANQHSNSRFCHRITELATLLGINNWGIP